MIIIGEILNKFGEAVGKYYKIDTNDYVVLLNGVRRDSVTDEELLRLCNVLELHIK